MDDNFRVVRRTDLPSRSRFNGSKAGNPHVRLHKHCNLHFSKAAAEMFDGRARAVVSYDEHAGTLKFTAVDKPPKGLKQEDCFVLNYHSYKGARTDCAVAVKRLWEFLRLEFLAPADVEIVDLNQQARSITVAVPPAPPANEIEPLGEETAVAAGVALVLEQGRDPVRSDY